MKAIAALREQFGGHAVLPEDAPGEGPARPSPRPIRPPRERRRAPPSDALVLFGATGDLAKKKIFPAVYEMTRQPATTTCRSIGFASSEWDDDRLRQHAREAIEAKGDVDEAVWEDVASAHHLRARRLPRPGVVRRAGHRSSPTVGAAAPALLPGHPAASCSTT